MILAENRVPQGAIYVSEKDFENDDSQVWFIAVQLRYYLGRITTAPIEIKINDGGSGIYIARDDSYTDDEFSLKTEGEKLFVTGGKRGVLYGGYELLESIGCRFFTPECEKIPTIVNLEIPDINKREKPVFEFRDTDYTSITRKPKFATMCRINGRWSTIPENMGGNIAYALGAHGLNCIVPWKQYRDTHPEYYSLVGGRRMVTDADEWQLCLSNPEIIDIAVENVRKILKQYPDRKIISISQNDNMCNCQCEECLKIDKEEGSPVGALLRFVNKIAEILEPEFPDVLFDVLAFRYSRPASTLTKTRHNVCVRLCASGTCFSHPYEKCDDRSRAVKHANGRETIFIEDLIDWHKICDKIYVWGYTANFPFYLLPFPNWRVLQPNLQTLVKYNVKGVFEEANCAENGGADFNELRTYLICKLLWDPYCDIDAHRKEFMEYFYGDAAPYLDEYLNMICDIVEQENYHLSVGEISRPNYLNDERLEIYGKLFDKAEAAVSGDGIRLARVQKARLTIRWVKIHWSAMAGKYDAEEINQFFTDLRAHNISRIDEWCNIERSYRGMLDGKTRGIFYTTPWRYDRETIL